MVFPLLTAGRMAMQALPYITAGYGALEGAKQGGLGGALAGGGLGFLGGKLGVGPLRGATKAGINAAPGIGSVLGIKGTPLAAKAIAAGAIPVAGGLLAAPLIGNLAGAAGPALAGGLGNVASGLTSVGAAAGAPGLGAQPTPGGMYNFDANQLPGGNDPTWGYGNFYGSMADAGSPVSRSAARRIEEMKEFDTSLRNQKLQYELMAPYIAGAKKEDLARNLYAMTVKNNQLTQSTALLGGLEAARNMGLNAASQVGAALAHQYQYV
jgi:hypothetical protein